VVCSDDVLRVLAEFDAHHLSWWLAGGWAVDALAERETRPHNDLDVLVLANDLSTVETALAQLGFVRADESELPAFLILRDRTGRQVDLYLVQPDPHGDMWQEYSGPKWDYFSVADLTGVGRIGSRQVRCLSPEALFRQFLGYRWTDKAVHDLRLLHTHRGTPLPASLRASGLPSAR
jgi:lincosamide nucleotidyltransferase A/C/D/E